MKNNVQIVKCEICGKEFDKSKRRSNGTHNLCSNECKYKFLGDINRKHSKSQKTHLYGVWKSMNQRCSNPNNKSYKNYGLRGIKVCEEWKNDFQAFYNWSYANGYSNEKLPSGRNVLSIDRIDINGNYEPSNCRWVTRREQQNNKRNTIYITYKGNTKTLIDWSKILDMNYMTLLRRFRDKWSAERMFETPIKESRRFLEYNGKRYKCSELAHQYGLRSETLLYRLSKGLKIDEALTKPLLRHKNQNLHNQITVAGHTVDSFLENLPQTP